MNNNDKLAKVAVHKSLLKEYSNSSNDRIVYMDDGTEFQIQIFNPYTYTIGVSLSFNNYNWTAESSLLVLRPGERIWLDRYLDNESRLLFSTYEVGNSQAVKEAIKDNGNLCIKFYKEQENKIYLNANLDSYQWNKPIDVYYNHIGSSYCDAVLENKSFGYCGNASDNASLELCGATIDSDSVNSVLSASTSCTYNGVSATYTATSTLSDEYKNSNKASTKLRSKSIETGRIEEGSHSNQKFNNVYKDFEYWPFKTEYIKILPSSQKQITKSDLSKKYCHNCGRKLSQKYKFCPFCGVEL